MAIMMTANQAFYVPGVAITNAQAVTKMAEMLGSILGMFGRYAYSIGFWAAVFASLLGVWQSVPYLYADFYSILKKLPAEERARVTKVTSIPYRLALVFVTLAPIPFAFTGQPLEVIVAYTIVGSLFVPFLAATLLYLNNRVKWASAVPHNNLATNALLVIILALFAIVGGDEALRAVGPFLGARSVALARAFSQLAELNRYATAYQPTSYHLAACSGNRKIVCGFVPALGLRPPPRPASVKYTWLL